MDGMFVGILGMCVLGVALYAGIGLLERLAALGIAKIKGLHHLSA